jgi:hypothetical protein
VNAIRGDRYVIAQDVIAKRFTRHELSETKLAPVTDQRVRVRNNARAFDYFH